MHQDHQTIGGYPKIGTVIAPDLWRLAQLPVATEISFAPVTANTGWGIYRHSMALYERTLPVLGATREPLKTYCAG
jgi:allophanate hydrolase subunit 2